MTVNPSDSSWRKQAACRGMNVDIFVPEGPGNLLYLEARTVCETCPVRLPCLEFALDNCEEIGMYGGLTPRERRSLRRSTA